MPFGEFLEALGIANGREHSKADYLVYIDTYSETDDPKGPAFTLDAVQVLDLTGSVALRARHVIA